MLFVLSKIAAAHDADAVSRCRRHRATMGPGLRVC
jgi:hypothetical protein